MTGIKCKLVERTGERFYLRIYWGSNVHGSQYGYHNAMSKVRDYTGKDIRFASREVLTEQEFKNYEGEANPTILSIEGLWPKKCDSCDATPPPFKEGIKAYPMKDDEAVYQYFFKSLYDEPPRLLRTGDMYWADWMPQDLDSRGHLMVICPANTDRLSDQINFDATDASVATRIWDTMSTATNCGHGNTNSHYCWTRTGEPGEPNFTISPSILIGNYHGWLRNGELVPA